MLQVCVHTFHHYLAAKFKAMQTQQAYNKWANTYDSVENKTRDLELVAAQQVLAHANFTNVLEIGCGTGKNTAWLSAKAKTLTAVDFSENMLEVARKKINKPHVQFIQADITKPWQFSKATLIVCSLVLEHIEDIDFIFHQAAGALQHDGCFYICELHPYKQLQGTRARFADGNDTISIEYFIHHISAFYTSAAKHALTCINLHEWFDDDNKLTLPRLVSFMFKKQ